MHRFLKAGLLAFFLFALPSASFAETPIISGAADISIEATTTAGAFVSFTITATDATGAVPVICTPPSGSVFAIGTTSVSCIADNGTASSIASFFVGVSEAATSSATTTPVADPTFSIEKDVELPGGCDITDTAGVSHHFPTASSSSEHLGICALMKAKDAGHITSFTIIDFGWGLWLDSIDGLATTADWSSYWALSHNGVSASVGLSDLAIAGGDTVRLDYASTTGTSTVILHIIASSAPASTPTFAGGSDPYAAQRAPRAFDASAALAFLTSAQLSDGSFGSALLSDWAAIAYATADGGDTEARLRSFILSANPALSSVTDYERHAMALQALGIDPYAGTGMNAIVPIVAAFDGAQIGDPHLDNDDIFALIPLMHAGHGSSDDIIAKTAAFVISAQEIDGSWDTSVDMTAAAIQALVPLSSLADVPAALSRAEGYLRSQQGSDAGWGNGFSTSWVLQAIAALGQTPAQWTKGDRTPLDALAALQQGDGGVESASSGASTRTWATAYAIPAAAGKQWRALLASFPKPNSASASAGPPAGGAAATSTSSATSTEAATSTAPSATSTPAVATSTPDIATSSLPVTTVAATTSVSAPVPFRANTATAKPALQTDTGASSAPRQVAAAASAQPDGRLASFFRRFFGSVGSFFRRLF